MYLAVSGNLGSGKTTLANGLARQFGVFCYPRTRYNESYILDLYQDPTRWTFEAQASFLLHKYNEIMAIWLSVGSALVYWIVRFTRTWRFLRKNSIKMAPSVLAAWMS